MNLKEQSDSFVTATSFLIRENETGGVATNGPAPMEGMKDLLLSVLIK